MIDRPVSLVMAIRDFFGMQPLQSIGAFAAEVKVLTDGDRAEFKRELTARGYRITTD